MKQRGIGVGIRKILSYVLCVAMVLSGVNLSPMEVQAAESSSEMPTQISESNYESYGLTVDNWEAYEDYYAINSASTLYGFAEHVNAGNKGANAVLTGNIDFSSWDFSAKPWTPICQTISYHASAADDQHVLCCPLWY